MISKEHIGRVFAAHTVQVEAGRLRFFAKAIGETDPVYTDVKAAQAAGYRDLPAPPTFLFCLEMEQDDPLAWLQTIGADLGRILHGEQSFNYYLPVCAGDSLRFETQISDIYDKKGGALEFVVRKTRVTNQHGEHVADLSGSVVQRNG
ncbi:MAG: MaoC family dehydratase N-terminal domain-containing protein [Burkholderiales bacterium]|nr:MaoC family dehydratase N-terminal domain-containing protein [Burkholderiales bacterium]